MGTMAEIETVYDAAGLDITRTAAAFRDHLAAFYPDPTSTTAAIRSGGRRLLHPGFDSLIAALPADAADPELGVAWYDRDPAPRIGLDRDWREERLRLRAVVPETDAARAEAAMAAFAAAAGLAPATEAPAPGAPIPPEETVRLRAEHMQPALPLPDLAAAFRETLAAPFGLTTLGLSVTSTGPFERSTELTDPARIADRLASPEPFSQLALTATPARDYLPRTVLALDADRRLTLEAAVPAPRAAEFDTALGTFATRLSLQPWVPRWQRRDRLVAGERRFGWLDGAPGLVTRLAGILAARGLAVEEWSAAFRPRRGDERRTLPPNPDPTALGRDLDPRLADAAEIEIYATGDAGGVELLIEPDLACCSFVTRAPTPAEAEALAEAVASGLGIELQPPPLYGGARMVRDFAVPEAWSGERFAREIAEAVRLRLGDRPLLDAADVGTVEDDGIETQLPFADLDAWLARLRDQTRPYASAYLRLRGPRGREMSVWLHDDRRRLEIRGAMPRVEFENMTAVLKKNLDLDRPAVPAPARSSLARLFDATTTTGKVALLAGSVLSGIVGFLASEVRGRLIPEYTITLRAPTPEVNAGCVIVTWEIASRSIFGGDLIDETGEVHVYRADGQAAARIAGHRSGTAINLPPGRYEIFVRDPERALNSEARGVTAADAGYADPAAAARRDCGPPVVPVN
jgi:hypothetical protein